MLDLSISTCYFARMFRDRLTHRENKFCELVGRGESAQYAHGQAYGYNINTHGYSNAGRLMARPDIQIRIAAIRASLEEEFKAERDTIVREMINIATCDVADFMEWDADAGVRVKSSGDLTPAQSRCIASVTSDGQGRVTVKFVDKANVLKTLAQVLGLLNGDVNIQQTNFVIRAPETAQSSEIWEQQARHFLEADAGDGEAEPASPSAAPSATRYGDRSAAAPAAAQTAVPYPPEPQTAVRDYGGVENRPEPQARPEAPRPNPKYRYR